MYEFRLFLTDEKTRSKLIEKLENLLQAEFGNEYILQVVDVFENPLLAVNYQVLATPTLLRTSPAPAVRMVGDLSGAVLTTFMKT